MFNNCKAIEISPNQHANLPRFLVTQDYLKITKGLELVSRPQVSLNSLIKKFILQCYINFIGQISLPDYVYFPSYSIKCISCFMLGHLMTS